MASILNATLSNGLVTSADNSGEIELQSNGTTALKVNTNEGIQILNCLGVGNATPSTSGAGITFPATQSASSDANTLDDYEEGTWTATIGNFTLNSGTFTFTARYTKIGRQVTINFLQAKTNVGTAGGRLWISNMPFLSLNIANGRPAVFAGRENAVTGIPVIGWVDGNATTGEIASLSFTAITWTNNYQYTFSVTYQQG